MKMKSLLALTMLVPTIMLASAKVDENKVMAELQKGHEQVTKQWYNEAILTADVANNEVVIARYLKSGDLDTAFNAGGINPGTVAFNLALMNPPSITDLTVNQQGTIIIKGQEKRGDTVHQSFTIQLNNDGTPDTSFDQEGPTPGIQITRHR